MDLVGRTSPPDRHPGGVGVARPPAPAVGRPRRSAADSGVRLSPGASSTGRGAPVLSIDGDHWPLALAGTLCLGLATIAGVATPAVAPAGDPAPIDVRPPRARAVRRRPIGAPSIVNTDAFTGAFGTASAIGWLGDHNSVITCLGGTFVIQDGPAGLFVNYGFGLYGGQKTTWDDADGYLPAQVTSFDSGGAKIAITEFADRIVVGGHPYVAVYSRVRVANPTSHPITVDPEASPSLVALNASSDTVQARKSGRPRLRRCLRPLRRVVSLAERRMPSPLPVASTRTSTTCAPSGTGSSSAIAQISLPNPSLVDAYKSGFITTQITRSGQPPRHRSQRVRGRVQPRRDRHPHEPVHPGLLHRCARAAHRRSFRRGRPGELRRWAVDLSPALGRVPPQDGRHLLRPAELRHAGPSRGRRPSPASRTPPTPSPPIAPDRWARWRRPRTSTPRAPGRSTTTRRCSASPPTGTSRRVSASTQEATWASQEYASLLAATNAELAATIAAEPSRLPALLTRPTQHGESLQQPDGRQLDVTVRFWRVGLGSRPAGGAGQRARPDHDRRHVRLRIRPPAGPAPRRHDGWVSRRLLLQRLQRGDRHGRTGQSETTATRASSTTSSCWPTRRAGPSPGGRARAAPDPASPWVGRHPGSGQGSSPHAWGIAGANKVLLDSLVAQDASGALVVGRGIPPAWLLTRRPIAVTNFPTSGGRRLGLAIVTSGRRVTLTLHGTAAGPVLFDLPSFVHNVAATTSGTVAQSSGTVTIRPTVHSVTVTLRKPPA